MTYKNFYGILGADAYTIETSSSESPWIEIEQGKDFIFNKW